MKVAMKAMKATKDAASSAMKAMKATKVQKAAAAMEIPGPPHHKDFIWKCWDTSYFDTNKKKWLVLRGLWIVENKVNECWMLDEEKSASLAKKKKNK